jgi:subtilisin family serine protease
MASPHVAGVAALCIASGTCRVGPTAVRSKLLSDAASPQLSTYGFAGDPWNPVSDRKGKLYYGYLTYAGGY